jgi:ATP-dependent protease HslVU (ClpYQ) peptidase subunit
LTTVVCNTEEMACDLQMTEGTKKWKCKTKIYKFKANPNTYPHSDFIVGFAGTAGSIVSVAEFFSLPDTTTPPKVKDLKGLVLTAEGHIFAFDQYTQWIRIDQKYAAIGSGGEYALGAVEMGASLREAIKVASKHDPNTGLGVKIIGFN